MVSTKKFEWIEILPQNIIESNDFTQTQKNVLGYLLSLTKTDFEKENGYFFKTNKEVAANSEVSERKLIPILNKFVNLKLIERKAGKRGEASEYKISFETLSSYTDFSKVSDKVSDNDDILTLIDKKVSEKVSILVAEYERVIEDLKNRLTLLENAKVSDLSKVSDKVRVTTDTDTCTETCKNNIDHNNNSGVSHVRAMVPVSGTQHNVEKTNAENIIISVSPKLEKRNDTAHNESNPNDDNNIDSISNEMDLQGCDTAHNENNPNDDTDTTDANPNDMTTTMTTTQGHSDPTVKRWISIISVLQTDWSQGDDTRRNEILNEVTDIAKQARAIRNEISDDVWCNLNDEMRKLKALMTEHTQSKSEGYINNPQPPRPAAYDPTTPKDVNQQSYRYMISACNLIQEGVRNVTKGISDKYARKIQVETVEDKIERMYKICARLTDKQWSIFLQYLNRWDDALDGKQDNRLKPINKDNEGAVNEMLVYVETINHTVSKWKATPDRERYNACEAVEDAKRRVMALRERLTDSQYSVYEEAVAKWNKTYTYNN